mmetsp:Transcript_1822/g.2587  ORF Transcript_1822/g.2587 Transcript_1822/m.2587 type:complete len:235 (-) Transcript_1822:127-831(-)
MFENDILTLTIVYSNALIPIPMVILMSMKKDLRWVAAVYLFTVILAACGWETWWTFGFVDGENVNDIYTSKLLKTYLPAKVCWLLNSLCDGTVALITISLLASYRRKPLEKASLLDAVVIAIFFNLQDLLVSVFCYEQVLLSGKTGLAPFSPVHAKWNPVTSVGQFEISVELPWIFMSFFWYPLALKTRQTFSTSQEDENNGGEMGLPMHVAPFAMNDGAATTECTYVQLEQDS